MSRPRGKKVWEHPDFKISYCFNRGGIVYTCVDGVRLSTPYRWKEANKSYAMNLLTERTKQHLRLVNDDMTISELIKEFAAVRLKDKDANTKAVYKGAFVALLTHERYVEDYKSIASMIEGNAKELQGVKKHNTISAYLARCKVLFTYALKKEYCTKNPLDLIEIPTAKYEALDYVYYYEDMYKLIEHLKTKNVEVAQVVEFAYLTAMRVGEILSLKRSDVHADYFLIHGKGGRYRQFPFTKFERLPELLNEVLQNKTGKDAIFNVPRTNLLKIWYEAQKALGYEHLLKFHNIRACCEYRWEYELKIPPSVICDLAGHTQEVRNKHYRKQRSAKEYEGFL